MVADVPWKTVTTSDVHKAAGDAAGAASADIAPVKAATIPWAAKVESPGDADGPFFRSGPAAPAPAPEPESAPWCDAFGISPWAGD